MGTKLNELPVATELLDTDILYVKQGLDDKQISALLVKAGTGSDWDKSTEQLGYEISPTTLSVEQGISNITYGEMVCSNLDAFIFDNNTTDKRFRDVEITTCDSAFHSPSTDLSHSNVNITIDGVVLSDSGSLASLEASASSGRVVNSKTTNLDGSGVILGHDDLNEQDSWGPWRVDGNVFDGISPSDSNNHYGIKSYSKYSTITNNFIRDIGSNIGTDTEGVYTKAAYSVVNGNILIDAGMGEGFINIQGDGFLSPTTPVGHDLTVVGNVCHATDTYIQNLPFLTKVTGVHLATDNSIAANNVISGMNGSAVHTSSDNQKNVLITGTVASDGDYEDGCLTIFADGGPIQSTGNIWDAPPSATYVGRVERQAAPTFVKIFGDTFKGGITGLNIEPTLDDVLDIVVDGASFIDNTTTTLSLNGARINSLAWRNSDIINGSPPYVTVNGTIAGDLSIENIGGITITTNSASLVNVIELPISMRGETLIEVTATAGGVPEGDSPWHTIKHQGYFYWGDVNDMPFRHGQDETFNHPSTAATVNLVATTKGVMVQVAGANTSPAVWRIGIKVQG